MAGKRQPTPLSSTTTTTTYPLHALHEQVLGDRDLLGEVLAFLPSVKDCRRVLLVNHLWSTTLDHADPWKYLLLDQYPSMGSLLLSSSLTTAKELLSTRLICANSTTNKKRELQRLKDFYRRKVMNFVVRHPEHGCIAACQIPINQGKDYKQFLEGNHALAIRTVLPVEEYVRCEVALQMPGTYSDFITCSNYEVDDSEYWVKTKDDGEEVNGRVWFLSPRQTPDLANDDFLDAKFTGFLHDNMETPYMPSFSLSFTGDYKPDIEEDAMLAAEAEGLEGKISLYMNDFDIASEFFFLKLVESWYVAAKHLDANSVVETFLRHYLQDTYMLIEVHDEDDCMQAFALVPFCDEASLMSLFQGHTTRLHFVKEDSELPDEDERIVTISILDLGRDRLVKLSKDFGDYDFESYCNLAFLRQGASFTASILPVENEGQQEENGHSGDNASQAFTVKLTPETYDFEGDDRDEQHFSSILDLWKFLSICMTGMEN
jgi:hypothetical protein